MDIKEIKQARQRCELEILAILNTFERQSGCEVEKVDIFRPQSIGIYHNKIEIVELDLRIK